MRIYMYSALFFNTNSIIMSVWWLELALVILVSYLYVYTFCTIFPCELYCNVCLTIRITGFGNFQNKYIVICILYQFLMWIQLWWWNKCICRSAIDTTLMNFLMTRNTITLVPINIQVTHIAGYILVVTWFD